jgi:sulfhydrogenase subunit gamma (sulfur reductase)
MMKNEYLPYKTTIQSIQKEDFDTNTYRLVFDDPVIRDTFTFKQGQFAEISILGIGEAPISIASSPYDRGHLDFTIRACGSLTDKIHQLQVGDSVYVRGPYGNSFPFDEIKHKNVYFVAGGIGLPPLRGLIKMVLTHRGDFQNVKVLYGAKTPQALCYKNELVSWAQSPDIEVLLTVDYPDESWDKHTGVVTDLWKHTDVSGENAVAFVCGPPIMIKYAVLALLKSGFSDADILMTLERYMKCGIGKCGHCNIGEFYVCVDGPVFTNAQLKHIAAKENIF